MQRKRIGSLLLLGACSAALAGAAETTLSPRRPNLPPAEPRAGITHPIDRLLGPYFKKNNVAWGEPVPDHAG